MKADVTGNSQKISLFVHILHRIHPSAHKHTFSYRQVERKKKFSPSLRSKGYKNTVHNLNKKDENCNTKCHRVNVKCVLSPIFISKVFSMRFFTVTYMLKYTHALPICK